LIDHLDFTCMSRSRIFHLYGDVTIAGEGLQNLGLCSAPGPLSREGSLSCHTCCNTGPRFFRSHPNDRPIQSPLTTHEGMWRIYSNPDPHGVSVMCLNFQRRANNAHHILSQVNRALLLMIWLRCYMYPTYHHPHKSGVTIHRVSLFTPDGLWSISLVSQYRISLVEGSTFRAIRARFTNGFKSYKFCDVSKIEADHNKKKMASEEVCHAGLSVKKASTEQHL
jgi:hypothetical protein